MIKCDVLVIGGGTAGCACAYIAAKNSLSVILIEKSSVLGGTMTSGLVIPMMYNGENQINTEFFNDLVKNMKILGGQVTYQNNPGWFNPELLKIALDKMLKNAGVKILFNSQINNIKFSNDTVDHAEVRSEILSSYIDKLYSNKIKSGEQEILSEYIEAKYFVDGTGNANFCQKINCEFLENETKNQPLSLRFIMSGVNLDRLSDFLLNTDPDRNVTTAVHAAGSTHLSTAYTWDTDKHWALAPLFDKAVKDKVLKDTDRNYFQIFTVAGAGGSVAFNCPRILKHPKNDDIFGYSDILTDARESILRLSEFCKKYLPGFENAYISNIANSIGVRVSNRVRGKYIYTAEDLKSGKKFKNPVLISNYPIDIHSGEKNSSTLEHNGEYQLPIESLMTKDYENVFVIGRCLSADFEAQAALRVQASCFSMGEGVAKYIANLIK